MQYHKRCICSHNGSGRGVNEPEKEEKVEESETDEADATVAEESVTDEPDESEDIPDEDEPVTPEETDETVALPEITIEPEPYHTHIPDEIETVQVEPANIIDVIPRSLLQEMIPSR